MSLKWTDVLEIAIQLDESKPEVDPRYVNFVDLRRWVVELPEFSDDPQRSGEKVLPAAGEERAMSLKWTDVLEIAIQLDESKPEVDPRYVNFVDLRRWVVELPEFSDDPQRSGEKVLEAIQAAWIEERD